MLYERSSVGDRVVVSSLSVSGPLPENGKGARIMTELRRILLVEDDPDIQDVTTVLLSHVGNFEVRACGTAAEALQIAQAFDPDLILLDVMMPGLDGQGAFAAFRQMPATASTPVIFMTARVQRWLPTGGSAYGMPSHCRTGPTWTP